MSTYADAPGTTQCTQLCPAGSDIDASRTLAADHDSENDCQLCVDGAHTVARTAKLHSKFRGDLLASMLDAERVVCNMVLFLSLIHI